MDRIFNFGILKSPRNIAIIIAFILLWYFGAFAAAGRFLSRKTGVAVPGSTDAQ